MMSIELKSFEEDTLPNVFKRAAEWVIENKVRHIHDVFVYYYDEYGDWNIKIYYEGADD